MTSLVSAQCALPATTAYVVYDIEAIGDIRVHSTCHIWNLAALNHGTGATFHVFVDPQQETYDPPPHPDLFPVNNQFLQSQGAQPFAKHGPRFFTWCEQQRINNGLVVLLSHGNFMLDKPLLEYEFGRLNSVLPPWLYFYDTLFWFRSVIKKQPSYSLKNLYKARFGLPLQQQHLAMPDVHALRTLLASTLPHGVHLSSALRGSYYPAYYTPLQRIKYVGNYNELLLIQGGVQCVEDLHITFLHVCRLNARTMQRLLEQRYHLHKDSAQKITNSLLHMLLLPTTVTP